MFSIHKEGALVAAHHHGVFEHHQPFGEPEVPGYRGQPLGHGVITR